MPNALACVERREQKEKSLNTTTRSITLLSSRILPGQLYMLRSRTCS